MLAGYKLVPTLVWHPHFHTRTQVFLYKRAQIFAGDLYGAFQGKGLGAFHDLHLITMFADYRCERQRVTPFKSDFRHLC